MANKKLDTDEVAALTKAIMDVRRDLVASHPLLAQIAAPNTNKDALIPIHPGAAAYFSGNEKKFLDKYGSWFAYGSMFFGVFTSLVAGTWKFMGFAPAPKDPIRTLSSLTTRIRSACDEHELTIVEEEIDAVLNAELARHGSKDSVDASTLSLAVHRIENLLNRRRVTLRHRVATAAATTAT